MKSKRGQFYLIMAMILIVIISGFISLTNYSSKSRSSKIIEIKKELETESSNVLDYSSYTEDNKIEDFTSKFSNYRDDSEIYYIIGESGAIEGYKYVDGEKEVVETIEEGELIKTTIDGENYEFDVKEGINFYFVIIKLIDGEKHVITN